MFDVVIFIAKFIVVFLNRWRLGLNDGRCECVGSISRYFIKDASMRVVLSTDCGFMNMERLCMGFYEINSNEKTVMYCTLQIELNNLKRSTD